MIIYYNINVRQQIKHLFHSPITIYYNFNVRQQIKHQFHSPITIYYNINIKTPIQTFNFTHQINTKNLIHNTTGLHLLQIEAPMWMSAADQSLQSFKQCGCDFIPCLVPDSPVEEQLTENLCVPNHGFWVVQ